MKILKLVLITGLLIFLKASYAEEYIGFLGTIPTATDKFYLSCGQGNLKINYQITNARSGAPCLQINSDNPAGNVSKSCQVGAWSPLITIATGAGAKFFTVKKSPAIAGTNTYRVRFHCYDQYGVQYVVGSPQTYIQNQ